MLRQNKGITLVELLAALAICSFLLVSITYVIHYTSANATNIGAREEALRHSRAIMERITKEVEIGLLDVSSDDQYLLKLDKYEYFITSPTSPREKRMTGDYTYFAFDEQAGSVTLTKNNGGETFTQVLSTLVDALEITLTPEGKRVDILLTVRLPRSQTYTTETTIYVPSLE